MSLFLQCIQWVAQCIQWVAPYRLCLTGISAAVALPVGAGALFLRRKALQRELWVGYLGAAFLIFACQYMALMAFEFVRHSGPAPAAGSFTAEDWAGAVASSLNNLFFLAAARSLMRRRPSFPWWALTLAVAAIVVDWGLELHFVSRFWRPFHRLADAGFSGVALSSIAYAMFVSVSPRRRAWLPATALLGGGLYVLVNVGYALVPPAITGSLGAELRQQLVAGMHLTETDLDTAFFAAAIPLKLILAAFACALVLRTIVVLSPRALRMTLIDVSQNNLDFFTGEGLLRLIAGSVRADRIAIYYRIPSLKAPRVAWWWWPYAPSGADAATGRGGAAAAARPAQMTRPEVRSVPAGDSLEGRVLSGVAVESLHIQRDRGLGKLPAAAKDPGNEPAEQGSVVMVPIYYNGFITGGMSLGWNTTYAFSPTTRQQAARLTEIVSVVAEARRRLAVILSWGAAQQRLDPQRSDGSGTVASELAGRLYQILCPLAAGIFLDVGFYPLWSVAAEERHLSGASGGGDRVAFSRAINHLAGTPVRGEQRPVSLRVGKVDIGEAVLVWPNPADQPQRPLVLCDPQLLQAVASLVAGAVLDWFATFFSALLARLGAELSALRIATPRDWLAAIAPTCEKAGLLWAVVVFGSDGGEHLGRTDAVEVVRRLAGERPELLRSGEPTAVTLPQPAGNTRTVVVLTLPFSGASLWLGVARAAFQPELSVKWPWGAFLSRLGEAADLVLAHITSHQEVTRLRQESEQFRSLLSHSPSADLFLHELINIARNVESGAMSLADDRRFKFLTGPPGLDKSIAGLQTSAGRLFTLIKSIEQDRSALTACRLLEVVDDVRRMIEPDLEEHRIALRVDAPAGADPRVTAPFHIVLVALLSLVRNSIDAIGDDGWIDIEIRDLGSAVDCDVIDTGHGFDPAIKEKILKGHSTKGRGRGRGLSSLERQFGGKGRVRVGESIPYQRTVFTLELDKQPEEGVDSGS